MQSRKCQEIILESRDVIINIEQRACQEGELQKTSKIDQLRILETEVRFRTHSVCLPWFTTRNPERRSQYCHGWGYVGSRDNASQHVGTATRRQRDPNHDLGVGVIFLRVAEWGAVNYLGMVDGPSPPDAGPSQSNITEQTTQHLPGSPIAQVYSHPTLQVPHSTPFPYYGHPNWQGQPWPVNGYQYNPYQQQYTQVHPYQFTQFQQYQPPIQVSSPARPSAHTSTQKPSTKRKARPRTPSPSPPPKDFPRHWDAALKAFFLAMGLSQCLAGLATDILVINPDWERKVVPGALRDLQSSISVCATQSLTVADVR